MKRRALCLLMAVSTVYAAKVTLTKVAAVSTIAVNVLEIKTTFTKAKHAAKTAKTAVVKAAKKIAGK